MATLPPRYETLASKTGSMNPGVARSAQTEMGETDKLVNSYLGKMGSNIPPEVKQKAKTELTRLVGQNNYSGAREYFNSIVGEQKRSIKKEIKGKAKPLEEMPQPEIKNYQQARPMSRRKNITMYKS